RCVTPKVRTRRARGCPESVSERHARYRHTTRSQPLPAVPQLVIGRTLLPDVSWRRHGTALALGSVHRSFSHPTGESNMRRVLAACLIALVGTASCVIVDPGCGTSAGASIYV